MTINPPLIAAALGPIRTTARLIRDVATSTEFAAAARVGNALAGLVMEPRWWRCDDPGWWTVQTVWYDGGSDRQPGDDFTARSVQVLIEVVDGGTCGVVAIEDWKPQCGAATDVTSDEPQDKSFGSILPGQGPVRVLSHERPPFGLWATE